MGETLEQKERSLRKLGWSEVGQGKWSHPDIERRMSIDQAVSYHNAKLAAEPSDDDQMRISLTEWGWSQDYEGGVWFHQLHHVGQRFSLREAYSRAWHSRHDEPSEKVYEVVRADKTGGPPAVTKIKIVNGTIVEPPVCGGCDKKMFRSSGPVGENPCWVCGDCGLSIEVPVLEMPQGTGFFSGKDDKLWCPECDVSMTEIEGAWPNMWMCESCARTVIRRDKRLASYEKVLSDEVAHKYFRAKIANEGLRRCCGKHMKATDKNKWECESCGRRVESYDWSMGNKDAPPEDVDISGIDLSNAVPIEKCTKSQVTFDDMEITSDLEDRVGKLEEQLSPGGVWLVLKAHENLINNNANNIRLDAEHGSTVNERVAKLEKDVVAMWQNLRLADERDSGLAARLRLLEQAIAHLANLARMLTDEYSSRTGLRAEPIDEKFLEEWKP